MVLVHAGVIAQAALHRAARIVVLHPVAHVMMQPAVVALGDDLDFTVRLGVSRILRNWSFSSRWSAARLKKSWTVFSIAWLLAGRHRVRMVCRCRLTASGDRAAGSRPKASSMMAWRCNQLLGRRFEVIQFVHLAEDVVLAQAEAVIRQQLVVDHVLVRADEVQDRPDVLLVGIHAGNQRRAGDEVDVGKGLVGFLEVLQDALVAHAGPFLVPLRDRSACGRAASCRRGAAPSP